MTDDKTIVKHSNLGRYLSGWANAMLVQVENRMQFLTCGLRDGLFQALILHAGQFAGRRPSWHIETGLLTRVKKAGLFGYFQDFDALDTSEFDDALSKAEDLMVEKPKYSLNKRRLIASTLKVRNLCKFPDAKFNMASMEEAALQMNKSSSASFPFYRRKGHCLDLICELAQWCLDHPGIAWITFLFPQTRGFRLQLREDSGQIKRKVRVMYPYPGHIICIEDMFIIPFVKHFIETDTFYVIGQNGAGISKKLRDRFGRKNSPLTSLDISHFDQSVINEAIIHAFWILRSQLRLTPSQDALYNEVVKYFCTSLMVSKDTEGNTISFIKTHGVPSGSGFTNMIDTLVHAIIIAYIEPSLLDEEKCLLCGDDIIFLSQGVDLERLYRAYLIHFNMSVSIDKTETYSSSKRFFFLGFEWIKFIRHVNPKLVINQMLWHTDFITDLDLFEREVSRGASILLNGINGSILFAKLFPDVISDIKKGMDIRFRYLYGTNPLFVGKGLSLNESVRLHLRYGYLIR